jgi:hypothetical protein
MRNGATGERLGAAQDLLRKRHDTSAIMRADPAADIDPITAF